MSVETHTTNAAKLRHTAAVIATDIAQAPLHTRQHRTLVSLNSQFVALDKTLTATSDTLTSTIARAQDLVMEALRWSSASYNGASLRAALDHSLASIDGRELSDSHTATAATVADDDVNVDAASDVAVGVATSTEGVVAAEAATHPVVSSEMAHP